MDKKITQKKEEIRRLQEEYNLWEKKLFAIIEREEELEEREEFIRDQYERAGIKWD